MIDSVYSHRRFGDDRGVPGMVSLARGIHVLPRQGISESRTLVGEGFGSDYRYCLHSSEVCKRYSLSMTFAK